MLKTEEISRIALTRKKSREKQLIRIQTKPTMRQTYEPITMRIPSSQEARPTRATLRRRTEEVRKDNTFAREPIQVRRLHAPTITPQVTPSIMRNNHQNIRSSYIRFPQQTNPLIPDAMIPSQPSLRTPKPLQDPASPQTVSGRTSRRSAHPSSATSQHSDDQSSQTVANQ